MKITEQDKRDMVIGLRDLARHNNEAADRMGRRYRTMFGTNPEHPLTRERDRLRHRAQHLTHLSRRVQSAKTIEIEEES